MSVSETDARLRYFFSRALNRGVAFAFSLVFFVLTVAFFANKQYPYDWAMLAILLSNVWFATSFGDVTLIADRTRGVLRVETNAPLRRSFQEYDFEDIKKVVQDSMRYTLRTRKPSRYFVMAVLKDGRERILYSSAVDRSKMAVHLDEYIRG